MSKQVRRRAAVVNAGADSDDEEGLEQQMQKKLAAQRVTAMGKRPRGLAADARDDPSDDDDDDDEFRDEYTFSIQDDPGLYKDANDYARILALSELDREMELAERLDIRQRNLDQFERRREIALEKRRQKRVAADAAAKKARSAAGAAREAAREREAEQAEPVVDARQQLLNEMREAREKRTAAVSVKEKAAAAAAAAGGGAKPRRRRATAGEEDEEEDYTPAPTREREPAHDDDDDDDARRERADARRAERSGLSRARLEHATAHDPEDAPAAYEQLERVRLKRNRLEAWVEEPFFDETVTGCFVRIGIGSDSGERVYRVAEIVAVTVGSSSYALGAKQTKKRLMLEIAGSRKAFQMSFVSNADFLPDELNKYRKLLEERVLPRRTQRELDAKVAQLVKAKNYVYNEADIARMVAQNLDEKRVIGRASLRKAELQTLREAAVELGNDDEVRRLDGLLAEIEALAEEGRRALEAANAPPSTLANSIIAINDRNKRLERAGKDTAVRGRDDAAEDDVNNPFARRETRPSMYWSLPTKKAAEESARAAAQQQAEPAQPAAAAAEPAAALLARTTTADDLSAMLRADEEGHANADRAEGAAADDDAELPALVAAHMLRLDLDLADPKAAPRPPPPPAAGVSPFAASAAPYTELLRVAVQPVVQPTTKRMSLHDYIQRRNAV